MSHYTQHYRKDLERRLWNDVALLRKAYNKHEISHAEYVFKRSIVLEEGSETNLSATFSPYFIGLMFNATGEKYVSGEYLSGILEKAKERAKEKLENWERWHRYDADMFRGKEVVWERFRPYDEDYNAYDHECFKTVLPWKFSEEDEEAFREEYTVIFHDPYGDGRDCTGAPFTGWMKFLRCKDRTFIYHCIEKDL